LTAFSDRRGFAMMRMLGLFLILAGGLLIAAVGWRYMQGARTRDAARAQWNELASGPGAAESVEQVVPGAPVARIIVPRLAIDEIVLEGVAATELNAAPGHHPRTPLPGGAGNSVISAHRDRHFFALGRAVLGDTVITQTLQDGALRWRIVGRRVAAADSAFVLPTDTPMLTLTTCWPIRHIGPAPDRLILTAEPIDLGDEVVGSPEADDSEHLPVSAEGNGDAGGGFRGQAVRAQTGR